MRAIKLSFKPLWVKVAAEREEIYNRVKKLLEKAELLANRHENDKVRLKAMEVAVRIAQFLEGTLTDAQLDEVEAELEHLDSGS